MSAAITTDAKFAATQRKIEHGDTTTTAELRSWLTKAKTLYTLANSIPEYRSVARDILRHINQVESSLHSRRQMARGKVA